MGGSAVDWSECTSNRKCQLGASQMQLVHVLCQKSTRRAPSRTPTARATPHPLLRVLVFVYCAPVGPRDLSARRAALT